MWANIAVAFVAVAAVVYILAFSCKTDSPVAAVWLKVLAFFSLPLIIFLVAKAMISFTT